MVKKPVFLWVAIVLVVAVTASVLGALAFSRSSNSAPSPTIPSAPLSSATPASALPAVAVLAPDLVLITHEALEVSTEFGAGVLIVSFPDSETGFRWVEGPAPVFGGRLNPKDAPFGSVPSNLPVVFSYDVSPSATGQGSSRVPRVSIFGRLAKPPYMASGKVVYELSLFDAPGKDSTYSVSGSYEIPEIAYSATLVISGQRLAD